MSKLKLLTPSASPTLRAFLEAAAGPAPIDGLPPLYATTRRSFPGRSPSGVVVVPEGARVRVTDAGRFGDVGITLDLTEGSHRDQARAALQELTDFSGTANLG